MNFKFFTVVLCLVISSCGSLRTFHEYARAGDTVAVPVGMQPDFSKNNITVTITPSSGPLITLDVTDPAIRAVINFYPDPISNMIISREVGENLTPFAQSYASAILVTANDDKDFFQTTVFVDLPAILPTGLTQIEIANGTGTSHAATLDVIPGTGVANTFNSNFNGGLLLDDNMLDSLARTSHTVVSFDATTLPYAIEMNLTHAPDSTVGGTGKAFVVNPLGYRKNLSWSDDGINMKIILTQSKEGLIDSINDYKFYISGSATNLQSVSVNGFDINGDVITGVTSMLTSSN